MPGEQPAVATVLRLTFDPPMDQHGRDGDGDEAGGRVAKRAKGADGAGAAAGAAAGACAGAAAGTAVARLAVAASQAGHLIGKGGQSVRAIRAQTGAAINVQRRADPSSRRVCRIVGPVPKEAEAVVEVTVSGSADAVKAAVALVESAAARTGRRRKGPRDGDDGELGDIFAAFDDDAFEQPAFVDELGDYPSTDAQFKQQQLQEEEGDDEEDEEVAGQGAGGTAAAEDLPAGWAKGWDPRREQVYYWHAATKTSAWALPAAPAGGDPPALAGLTGYGSSSSDDDD